MNNIDIKINNISNIITNYANSFLKIVSKNVRLYGTKFYLRIIDRIKRDEIRPHSLSSRLGRYPSLYKTGSFVDSIKIKIDPTSFTIYSNDLRAKILNDGGVINHPGGTPYMVVTDKVTGEPMIRWVKKSTDSPHILGHTRPHPIRIPAFNWLRLNSSTSYIVDEMIKEIKIQTEEIKV